ncbi:hypothetical protein D3C85_570030 [compost metagenome]
MQQTQLRVHEFGLARLVVEEVGVELEPSVEIASGLDIGRVGDIGFRHAVRAQRVVVEKADQILAAAQVAEKFLGVGRTRQPERHADHGNFESGRMGLFHRVPLCAKRAERRLLLRFGISGAAALRWLL